MTTTRTLAAALLALAACGGGELDADGDAAELEQAPAADAGAAPVRDAGPAAVDAAEPAAQCAPDSGVGDPAVGCWTRAELVARGCVAVLVGTATPGVGSSTTVLDGAAAAAKAAHSALTYVSPGAVTLYLCASPAPAGWRCVSHKLSDCSGDTSSVSCTPRLVVPALPTASAVCAREPV